MSNWPDNQGGLQESGWYFDMLYLPPKNAIYPFALLYPVIFHYIILC